MMDVSKIILPEIQIYCDGSCWNKPGEDGGYGSIMLSGKYIRETYGHLPAPCTNNIAEFMSLLESLYFVKSYSKITVYTDSMLLIGYSSLGWKRKNEKLAEIGKLLDKELSKHSVTFVHVKGHSGNVWNEKADVLADTGQKLKTTKTIIYEK